MNFENFRYVTGFLRHMLWLQDRRHIYNIIEQYEKSEIDRETAKRQLLFAGFYPISAAVNYLHFLDIQKSQTSFRELQ